jgi:hypothetical protein
MTSQVRFKRFVDLLARQAAREWVATHLIATGTTTNRASSVIDRMIAGTSTATSY